MTKKYDVVARVGEYMDNQGQPKARFKNVGAIIEKDGKHMLLLDKTFNPAGLAEPDRESIILSLFDPQPRAQQAPQAAPQPAPVPQDDFDDDIPF